LKRTTIEVAAEFKGDNRQLTATVVHSIPTSSTQHLIWPILAKKANSDVKSGVTNKNYVPIIGGNPPKKSIDEIEKVNKPKTAPGSVRA
jgi:hypothetical protein